MQNKFRLKRHFSKKHTRGFSYNKFSALSLQSRRERRSAKSKHRWRSQIASTLDERWWTLCLGEIKLFIDPVWQIRDNLSTNFRSTEDVPVRKHFHCRHSALDESLCKDILLFYVNEVEHNNLYLERKWDNNVSWGNLWNQLIYKLPSPGKELFYVATNSKHNKQSHQRSHLLRIGTQTYILRKYFRRNFFNLPRPKFFNSVHSVVFPSSFLFKTSVKRNCWLKTCKIMFATFSSGTSFKVACNGNLFVRMFLLSMVEVKSWKWKRIHFGLWNGEL